MAHQERQAQGGPDEVAVTLDIDWAPDFVIDFTAELLLRHGVRATWFVTHDSPAVRRLREHPGHFELGIHPNFLPGSTQGTTPTEILDFCMGVVPEARSMRTHALVQSTPILEAVITGTPIVADASLFLPGHPCLRPIRYDFASYGRSLLRVPYNWEDDYEADSLRPEWELSEKLEGEPGLRIFDFHPIHVYLNSSSLAPYCVLKSRVRALSLAEPREVEPFVHRGAGTGTAFAELLEHLSRTGGGVRIGDVYDGWCAGDGVG